MIERSDTWPEDEAQLTALQYRALIQDENKECADQWRERQIAHMKKVFDDPHDTFRYLKELNFLLEK
jgi:hypothetical protein